MPQKRAWENEYRNQKLVSVENKPHAEIVRLARTLKKKYNLSLEEARVLDIGCGTGRNAFYFTEEGASVTGIDISENAIQIAKRNAQSANLSITYYVGSIAEPLPIENESIDLVIDILASNSLLRDEIKFYTHELARVLKPGGFFFLRALAKEGDVNAAQLLKLHPGTEENTYVLPALGITETVYTKEKLLEVYGSDFELLSLEKKAHYPKIENRIYKRQFYYALFRKTV